MNGEDFCRVLLERSSQPLRPTRPALARSRSLARFAHSLARPGTQAPQPLAENPYDDTMSGVPTTEKCLLPRVVMRCPLLRVREGFPYAVERRGEVRDPGEADAGRSGVRPLGERGQSRGAYAPRPLSLVRAVIRDEARPPRQR